MTDDRTDAALERLGSTPVAPPTAAFADALEQRLRAQHGVAPVPEPRRTWGTRVAAVAAAVLLAAGLALALRSDPGPDVLVLASANDASVVFPDGRVAAAVAGLELPEGTLVVTGTDGAATADRVQVGADSLAVVEDGRLRLLERGEPAPPAPTTTERATTTTTSRPGSPTTTSPTTSRPPAPSTTTTIGRGPTTTTTTPVRPPVARLVLRAERLDRRTVALRWSAYTGPGFARYVVVRTLSEAGTPPEPGTDATAVFTTTDAAVRGHRDGLPPAVAGAAYRVLVLDADNTVIGASRVARA